MLTLGQRITQHKGICIVLGIVALFLFFRVSAVDMVGDDAHYTIRSIGYIDMMFSDKQTTPLQWFDTYPPWAYLSFHDHPALLFVTQHIFLSFHESLLFAKLPYILFSLATVLVLYVWMSKEHNKQTALWATLFLATNSLFLWLGRTAFLEAGVIFFVTLSLYAFSRFLSDKRQWIFFGVSLGLALASKYNTWFLIPSIFVYLLWQNRAIFRSGSFYKAIGLACVFLLPSLVYNTMMYTTTGHFDYQFSRLFHQERPWVSGEVDFRFSLVDLVVLVGRSVTYPLLALSLGILGYAFFWRKELQFVGICVFFLSVMFLFTGAGVSHAGLYTIFFSIVLGWGVVRAKNVLPPRIVLGGASFFVLYLAAVAINSHMLIRPIAGKAVGWTVSEAKSENTGLYQLDQYLATLFEKEHIAPIRDGYTGLKKKAPSLERRYGSSGKALQKPEGQFDHMIIYDENLAWFAELWPFKRRRFYHNAPILSTDEFVRFGENIDIDTIYFIRPTRYAPLEPEAIRTATGEKMEQVFIDAGLEPEYIYRLDGHIAFNVYKITKE